MCLWKLQHISSHHFALGDSLAARFQDSAAHQSGRAACAGGAFEQRNRRVGAYQSHFFERHTHFFRGNLRQNRVAALADFRTSAQHGYRTIGIGPAPSRASRDALRRRSRSNKRRARVPTLTGDPSATCWPPREHRREYPRRWDAYRGESTRHSPPDFSAEIRPSRSQTFPQAHRSGILRET